MKRIVIIEGNALSLHRFGETYEVRIDNDRAEVALPLTPEAAEQIGASFREPIRVVVEIGDGEIAVGSLAGTTREELVHALAAARHAADEYQRENEALVKSNEGLRYDFDAMAAKNDELLEKIAAEAIPEGGLTREQLCRELATAHYKAEEARREVESLSRRLEFRASLFDPEKHITKATVAKWLEHDADLNVHTGERLAAEERAVYEACAADTRAIIARINDCKETP